MKNAYILVAKPKGKIPVGSPRLRWKCNIRLDLRERGWDGVDWIHLARDGYQWWSLVSAVMNLRVL